MGSLESQDCTSALRLRSRLAWRSPAKSRAVLPCLAHPSGRTMSTVAKKLRRNPAHDPEPRQERQRGQVRCRASRARQTWIEPPAWLRHRRGLAATRSALPALPSVLVLASRMAGTGSPATKDVTRSDLSTGARQAPVRVPRHSRSAPPHAPPSLLRQQHNGAPKSEAADFVSCYT